MRPYGVFVRVGLLLLAGLISLLPGMAQQPAKPYKVTIVEEKNNVASGGVTPVDPKIRLDYQQKPQNNGMEFTASLEGKLISENISGLFMIDGQVRAPIPGKQQKLQNLPSVPSGKKRFGSQFTWDQSGLRITKTMEVVPGKRNQVKPGGPPIRRMDTLLVKYSVENTSNIPHRVACRGVVENGAISEPGLRYFSPLRPKETLLGVILEKKEVPPFLEALERDDLLAPGFKGILTFKFGDRVEMPSRIVLTRIGLVQGNGWDIQADPGVFSVCVFYWDERVLQPKAKREFVFAYGQGLATMNEGLVSAEFGGSFAPGKTFTLTAYVHGPLDGQSLTLQLPQGIELVSGRTTQLVPLENEATGQSVVAWRCRVMNTGSFPISIRSNNGVTQTWTVTVAPPD